MSTSRWLMVIALVALAAGVRSVASAQQPDQGEAARVKPEQFVLENVPYIGPDWQNRLDGPQDFMLPSAMGSVMKYLGGDPAQGYRFYLCVSGLAYRQLWHPARWDCAFDSVYAISSDPIEPIRRCLEAAGYDFRVIGNRAVCEKRGLTKTLPEYGALDDLRREVCASLQAGRPVIALGLLSAAAVVAGYEDEGRVLLGWTMVDNEGAAERDNLGYLRFRDWLANTEAVVVIGDKRPPLPPADVYRKALLWAVEGARTPKQGEYAGGLAAFSAWADALGHNEELPADDLKTLGNRHMAHFFISLAVAEGRAFGSAIFPAAGAIQPAAAADLQAAEDCYHLMHDLVWRLWQTEGPGTDEDKLRRFADPEVRRELQRIILIQRDKDAEAVAHLERALLAMGAKPEDIPPASAEEKAIVAGAEARERSTGADRASLGRHIVDLWVGGVPMMAWARHKDCTFIGALEAALASTAYPCSYTDLMGYSGLAFRTRWFHNPTHEQTPWGTLRWHPVSPHGEQPDVLEALSRTTGWRSRREELPEQGRDLARERLVTDTVLSINEGLPVMVGYNTDLAVIYGYNIHSINLFLRDYQRPDQEDLRIPSNDPGLQSPFIFLQSFGEPLPPREALLDALKTAAGGARRSRTDGFLFGPAALAAWRDDLAQYDTYDEGERNLLSLANWWTLMHLADARRAAVEFLDANAGLLTGEPKAALLRALSLYRQEADLLKDLTSEFSGFVMWWGGGKGVADWDADTRTLQQDALEKARGLEEEALGALDDAVARGAGDPG